KARKKVKITGKKDMRIKNFKPSLYNSPSFVSLYNSFNSGLCQIMAKSLNLLGGVPLPPRIKM
ncbi:MAG: hypothetical protein QXE29_04560, partial [Candidatus Hadarchaeales archaeon]